MLRSFISLFDLGKVVSPNREKNTHSRYILKDKRGEVVYMKVLHMEEREFLLVVYMIDNRSGTATRLLCSKKNNITTKYDDQADRMGYGSLLYSPCDGGLNKGTKLQTIILWWRGTKMSIK